MPPLHFEQISLAQVMEITSAPLRRKPEAPKPDPVLNHFKRQRLPGFGDELNVSSRCVRCGETFAGDIRDGIIEQEYDHVLACLKRDFVGLKVR